MEKIQNGFLAQIPTLPIKIKDVEEIISRSVSRNSDFVENVTNAKIVLKKDTTIILF